MATKRIQVPMIVGREGCLLMDLRPYPKGVMIMVRSSDTRDKGNTRFGVTYSFDSELGPLEAIFSPMERPEGSGFWCNSEPFIIQPSSHFPYPAYLCLQGPKNSGVPEKGSHGTLEYLAYDLGADPVGVGNPKKAHGCRDPHDLPTHEDGNVHIEVTNPCGESYLDTGEPVGVSTTTGAGGDIAIHTPPGLILETGKSIECKLGTEAEPEEGDPLVGSIREVGCQSEVYTTGGWLPVAQRVSTPPPNPVPGDLWVNGPQQSPARSHAVIRNCQVRGFFDLNQYDHVELRDSKFQVETWDELGCMLGKESFVLDGCVFELIEFDEPDDAPEVDEATYPEAESYQDIDAMQEEADALTRRAQNGRGPRSEMSRLSHLLYRIGQATAPTFVVLIAMSLVAAICYSLLS